MDNIKELISQSELSEKVSQLGKKISEDYNGEEIVLIGVLKGAFIFLADLARAITLPCEIDFMQATSYNGTTSTGIVNITKDVSVDV